MCKKGAGTMRKWNTGMGTGKKREKRKVKKQGKKA
jgi:hypothetical protein